MFVKNKKAILGFVLVDPILDLGLWVGMESTVAARRKRVRSSSSSGKEIGGGGGGRMCEAKKKRIGRESERRSNVGIHGDGDEIIVMN